MIVIKNLNDLGRAILRGANLTGGDLVGANLSGARLSDVNLAGANLTGVDLIATNLSGARLSDVNLTDANLTRARLDGANLTRARLAGANLADANLDDVSLIDAIDIICAGYDRRGYRFIGVKQNDVPWRVLAGCRWFEPDEAREHWRDNKDALARLAVIANAFDVS
jgi:uncharacterized protein YjbI with pentapeptide repeats